MKYLITVNLVILTLIFANAQDLKVESMKLNPFEIMQNDKIRYDLNSNKCALVRVSVNEGEFSFSGNIVGDIQKDGSDYLVYMSPGSKNIQIKHPRFKTQLIEFKNFNVDGVKGGAVYVINLTLIGHSKEDIVKVLREEAKADPDIGGFDNGLAWVDLGLPSGNKWAAWNVGGHTPNELGDKFMWAQRFSPTEFTEEYYVHSEDFMNIPDFSGNPDYDAASLIMGMNWRMPLEEDFKELIEKCVWNYYSDQQKYKVTGPNGRSIYFKLDILKDNSAEFWCSSHATEFEIFDSFQIDYLRLGDGDVSVMSTFYPYEGKHLRAIYDPYSIQLSSNEISDNLPLTGYCEGHEWIDLGLSVNWANCNLGASSQEESGIFFAWGNPRIKSNFSLFDEHISNFEDPASIYWRSKWRMPTYSELYELRDKCQWIWTGKGYNIIGPNGNSIYLPAAGETQNKDTLRKYIWGNYWSSFTSKDSEDYACAMCFVADKITIKWVSNYIGFSIRPVIEKQ